MDDKAAVVALYRQMKKRIRPLFEGKSTAVINAALSETMVDVALNGQVGKSRIDAMEMLGASLSMTAKQARVTDAKPLVRRYRLDD